MSLKTFNVLLFFKISFEDKSSFLLIFIFFLLARTTMEPPKDAFSQADALKGKALCDTLKDSFTDPSNSSICGPPDTFLYSREGISIKVHKVRKNIRV